MTSEDIELLNAAVAGWNNRVFGKIKNRYLSLINSPKRSGDGFESLGTRLGKKDGEVDYISYKFNRYLVFVYKGVGKGRPIKSGKEQPKPWLTPVIDDAMPELADIVARIKTDAVVKAIDIK